MARTIITARDIQSRQLKATRGVESTPDSYIDRLGKYIPGESVALYVTLNGLVAGSELSKVTWFPWVIFGIALVFTPLYLVRVAKVSKGGQVLISTVSFVIWALAIGGTLQAEILRLLPGAEGLYHLAMSLVLVVFTAFIPVINPGAGSIDGVDKLTDQGTLGGQTKPN